MRLSYQKGILLEEKNLKLFLDPQVKIKEEAIIGISHAHSDHLKPHDTESFSTPQTKQLSKGKIKKEIEYGKIINLNGWEISLHDSNHILGSAQFLIKSKETSIAYTGDFRLNESVFDSECELLEADYLIIESTYGLPGIKFPEQKTVEEEIKNWVKNNQKNDILSLIGAYSLGKSQEIIKILNQEGIVPSVHPKIAEYCKIYEQNGIKLKYSCSKTEPLNDVVIIPPHLINKVLIRSIEQVTKKKTKASMVTGWGAMYDFKTKGIEKTFILSDHADFYQIIEYIKATKPKKVFTVHGYSEELAEYLNRRIVKAKPLHHFYKPIIL